MDYESEEGSDAEEGDGEEAEERSPEGEAQEPKTPDNADPLPTETSDYLADTEPQDEMRVNAVLGIGNSIESYRYDGVNGLWCEVGVKYLQTYL